MLRNREVEQTRTAYSQLTIAKSKQTNVRSPTHRDTHAHTPRYESFNGRVPTPEIAANSPTETRT